MKRQKLLKHLKRFGCLIEREGNKHTVVYNPITNRSSTVPRHNEINTFTGKNICKDLGIDVINLK